MNKQGGRNPPAGYFYLVIRSRAGANRRAAVATFCVSWSRCGWAGGKPHKATPSTLRAVFAKQNHAVVPNPTEETQKTLVAQLWRHKVTP